MNLEKITALKPTFATALSGIATAGPVAVYLDIIKAWAGAIVVLISIPTGFCMLVYWALKAWKEWRAK